MRISLRSERALRVLHYIFLIALFTLAFIEYRHIKALEAQIPLYITEYVGPFEMKMINPEYEVVMRAKISALSKTAPLLLGAFLTDGRILMALGWIKKWKPEDDHEKLEFGIGLITVFLLVTYAVLLLTFELQALAW